MDVNKGHISSADEGNSCSSTNSLQSVRRCSSSTALQNNNNSNNNNNNSAMSPRRGGTPTSTPPTISTPTHRSTPSPNTSGTVQNGPYPAALTHGGVQNGNKIISRNVNGTLTLTSAPSNEAELQLYRVMQRASLLSYYDTLLEMGGDDVQQLCDAGEEEFLEIMALIGMASKPLHVRRLQKALHEWMTNPQIFQLPLISINYNEFNQFPAPPNPRILFQSLRKETSPSAPLNTVPSTSLPLDVTIHSATPSPGPPPGSPIINPVLTEAQLSQICDSARRLSRLLPNVEPKQSCTKKKLGRELEFVMTMTDDNPRRMDEVRKFSAIYGRFDCKRKAEKPLTLHEISVNEAAAQLCRFIPALLTRRDELFPLARQVVRDCDYHRYSKISAMSSPPRTRSISTDNSSDSETTSTSGDVSEPIVQIHNKSPLSIASNSPAR